MSLEEWWREVVEGKLPNENGLQELEHQKEYQKEYQKEAQDGMKGGQAGVSDDKGQHGEWAEDKTEKDERDALHVYADATDILISIAETLLSLHQRRLLLSTVRPDFFACRKPRQSIPIASPSGNSYDATSSLGLSSLPRSTQPHRTLELRRFSSVVPLPGFAGLHQSAFPSHPHQSPDHSSTPLTRPSLLVSSSQDGEAGPSEDSGWAGEDEEAFIKANLRWLAPEIFSSKRSTSLSERADVYSFGVLMWELMTGSPIEPEVSDLLADIHNHLTAPVPNPADFVASSRSIPSFLSSEPMPELSQSLQSSSLDPLPVLSSSFCAPPRPPIPKALAEISLRCLQKDLDDRYTSIPTLLHDLREFQRLARSPSPSELEAFEVGAIDRASRFQLSLKLVDRTSQTEELDRAFAEVASSSPEERKGLMLKPGVLEVWGASGSGKTGVVTRWAKGLEKEGGGQKCLVGWAKLDRESAIECKLDGSRNCWEALADAICLPSSFLSFRAFDEATQCLRADLHFSP
jgi:serine/threonine protein kinase